jgi:aspartyl-tRNA(Asn)/glutamyl-tRNA(Gln) amidotransferase subunit A
VFANTSRHELDWRRAALIRDGELETAVEIREALDAGKILSVELVERALRRAEAWQPAINAFSQLWPEVALDEARRLDALPRPEWRPMPEVPLLFAPLAIKDLFDVRGHETTGCCEAYRGLVPPRDSAMVARVRKAEALMIGKTNQHELAAGGTNTVSACGRTGNPWDPTRMTGGSSGGSAAAVAAGIVPLAMGSDTGGSIRIPAAMCGTFGLKPTTGKLPTAGMMPLAPSLDCPGPLASTAADLALLYEVMAEAGPSNPGRPRTGELEPGPAYTMPALLRIGVPDGFFVEHVHPEALATVAATAAVFEANGVDVEAVDGRGIDDAREVWMQICAPQFASAHPLLKDRRDRVHPSVVLWLERGERLSEDERLVAARRRADIGRWFRARLGAVDALLIPTTPYPAPVANRNEVDLGPFGTVSVDRIGPGWLTCSVNLAGLPAVNLPAGRSREGLPIGVSLVGRDDAESTLLQLAMRWEEATGYRPMRPAPPA